MATDTTVENSKRIYVGNLAPNVTQEDLAQLFGLQTTPYLRQSCKSELATCDKTGKSKGFAFITVPEHVSTELMNLNGIEFYGRQLVIEESKTDRNKDENDQKKDGDKKGTGRNNKGGRGRGGKGRWRGRNNRNISKWDVPKLLPDQTFNLIDGGVNLTNPKFHNNEDYVVNRAQSAGVQKMVVTGLRLNGCKTAITKAKTRTNIYAAVGIHPHFVKDDWNAKSAEEILTLAKSEECVAVGECGLDYNRNYSEKSLQKDAFKRHIEIACEAGKPLLVHDRDAHDDIIEMLTSAKNLPTIVIHCFTGSADHIKAYINRGWYIGVTGFVCKDKHGAHLREAIKSGVLPLERIILQSDAPYMVPNMPLSEIDPVSKSLLEFCYQHNNEPCTLSVIVRCIAKVKDMEARQVADILTENAMKVYRFRQ